MLTTRLLDLRDLQSRGEDLAAGKKLGKAEDPWLTALPELRPAISISTADCAEAERYLKSKDLEKPIKFRHAVAPYIRGIEDACDTHGVTVVGVKGPARGLKTTAAENVLFRNANYGPTYEVIWFMQSREDVEEFCEERLEPMLQMHDRINQHVNWRDRRHSLTRKRIRGALHRFLAATPKSLRAKMAPIIVGDEIDGYAKRVRKGFLTMAKNRQRELGIGALLYVCSHPDEGPTDGIDVVIAQSLRHLWYVNCPKCRKASSPAVEAEVRMTWNVPKLTKNVEDMDLREILDMVEREARLVCPHCSVLIDNDTRLEIMREGTWLQPHQQLDEHGVVHGDPLVERTMGFVIHGFMLPWGATIGEMAREYVAAKLNADSSQDTSGLKETVCKTLGETFLGASEEEQMEEWKAIQGRLTSQYPLGFVPRGVRFLVAFVDVQGDRFEVRVIGHGAMNERWLIDAYALKQWPQDNDLGHAAFQNIDPANRLGDWDIIEEAVIKQQYPLVGNDVRRDAGLAELFLPIAKTMVDAHGVPGVHLNAIRWVAAATDPQRQAVDRRNGMKPRQPIELWKVQLIHGDSRPNGEKNKRVKKHLNDDKGMALPHQVYERTINVHHYKLIIARASKVEQPGPGRIHMPANLPVRYVREFAAERLVNGVWETFGRNETWDGFVAGEAAKDLLPLDKVDWENDLPIWATPIERGGPYHRPENDAGASAPKSRYERLLDLAGRGEDEGDEDDAL